MSLVWVETGGQDLSHISTEIFIYREKTKTKSVPNFVTCNSYGAGATDPGANDGFEQKLEF